MFSPNLKSSLTQVLKPLKIIFFISLPLAFIVTLASFKTNFFNIPSTYEDCLQTPGSRLLESYPAVCITRSGLRFTQPVPDQISPAYGQPSWLPSPSPSGEDTSTWQTYTSPDGYSFQYPQEFSQPQPYSEGEYSGISTTFLGPNQVRIQSELADGIVIKTLSLPKQNAPLKDFATQQRLKDTQSEPIPLTVSPLQETTLAGQTAYTYSSEGYGNIRVYFLKHNQNIIEVVALYAGNPETLPLYLSKINLILSTFRFLDIPVDSSSHIPNSPPDSTSNEPPNVETYEGVPIEIFPEDEN